MSENIEKQLVVVVLKQGWMASTWSDVQTFGFLCGSFAINSLLLNNNDWLNATLFFTFFLWVFSKAELKSKDSKSVKRLATTDPAEAIEFLEKHGRESDNPAGQYFVDIEPWQRQKRDMKMEDFKGFPCRVSVNYGTVNEPIAVDITFLKDKNYHSFKRFYSKQSTGSAGVDIIMDRDELSSVLHVELKKLHEEYEFSEVAIDPWESQYLFTGKIDRPYEIKDFRLLISNLSFPTKVFQQLIISEQYWHDGNPMMMKMIYNTRIFTDKVGNVLPIKAYPEDPSCQTNGVIASIMSLAQFQQIADEVN